MKFKLSKRQLRYALELAKLRHDAKHESFRNKDVARFMNEKKEEQLILNKEVLDNKNILFIQ